MPTKPLHRLKPDNLPRSSIRHIQRLWSLKEDNILKTYWPRVDVDMTREELCDMLNHRTWDSVRNRATRLSLPLPRNTRFQSPSVNYEILEQMDRRIKI